MSIASFTFAESDKPMKGLSNYMSPEYVPRVNGLITQLKLCGIPV